MACEPPEQRDVPLSRWSAAELAAQAASEGLVDKVSASTVRRWLAEDAIKPWQFRSWIFPRDPDFAAKAARVLDRYDRTFDGEALGEHDYVISADEKSQLQALARCHPGQPTLEGEREGSSSSTTGAGPLPTSPPTTCTAPRSWAPWHRRRASSRSKVSSTR